MLQMCREERGGGKASLSRVDSSTSMTRLSQLKGRSLPPLPSTSVYLFIFVCSVLHCPPFLTFHGCSFLSSRLQFYFYQMFFYFASLVPWFSRASAVFEAMYILHFGKFIYSVSTCFSEKLCFCQGWNGQRAPRETINVPFPFDIQIEVGIHGISNLCDGATEFNIYLTGVFPFVALTRYGFLCNERWIKKIQWLWNWKSLVFSWFDAWGLYSTLDTSASENEISLKYTCGLNYLGIFAWWRSYNWVSIKKAYQFAILLVVCILSALLPEISVSYLMTEL